MRGTWYSSCTAPAVAAGVGVDLPPIAVIVQSGDADHLARGAGRPVVLDHLRSSSSDRMVIGWRSSPGAGPNRRLDAVDLDHVGRVAATVQRVQPPPVRGPSARRAAAMSRSSLLAGSHGLRFSTAPTRTGGGDCSQRRRGSRGRATDGVRPVPAWLMFLDARRHLAFQVNDPRRASGS